MYSNTHTYTERSSCLGATEQEMRHFKAMLRKVDNTFVKDYAPAAEQMAALAPGAESVVILAHSD